MRNLTLFELITFTTAILIFLSVFLMLFRSKQEIDVVVKVTEESLIWPSQGVPIWYANRLRVGMAEKDMLGRPMATITKIRRYDTMPTKKSMYLTVRLNAVHSPRSGTYNFKGRNVLVGSPISLTLDNVLLEGLVSDIIGTQKPYPSQKLLATAELFVFDASLPEVSGVLPYVADAIDEGDTVLDNNGNIVIRVVKKETSPADKIVSTYDGSLILRPHPIRKNVRLTLEIDALLIDGRYYLLDDIPILIDRAIPVLLEDIFLFPVITDIQEVDQAK